MSTVGNTTTPNQTYSWYGTSASNVLMISLTMPQAGTITSISCYMAGKLAAINPIFCIWDSSGNLIGQTATLSVIKGTGALGGQVWTTANLVTPRVMTNGQSFLVGFWRPTLQSDEWSEFNAGSEYQETDTLSAPPNPVGVSTTTGTPGFYCTYTASPSYVYAQTRRSGIWTVTSFDIHVRRTGAWNTAFPCYIRRSGVWVRIQ